MHSAVKIAKAFLEKPQEVHDMTPMKLLKLTYMAHGWMLALHDRQLVSEDVWAWKYGPVIPELYREIKAYGSQPVVPSFFSKYNLDLDVQEQSIVDQVYSKYAHFTGLELSAMTHASETPWHKVWHSNGQEVIPDCMITEYYRNLSGHGR